MDQRTAIIILVILILAHAVLNSVWLRADEQLAHTDFHFHILSALRNYDIMTGSICQKTTVPNQGYPPLAYLAPLPFMTLLGRTDDAACYASILWMAILVIFTYLIGTRLGNRAVGLVAAFLVSTYPMIFGMSRQCWPDLALAAMVTVSVYLLLASELMTRRSIVILLGVFMGASALSKIPWFIFVEPLLIVILIYGWMVKSSNRADILANIFISHSIAFVVALPWYLGNLFYAFQFASDTAKKGVGDDPQSILSISGLLHYLKLMIETQVSLLYFLAFMLAILFLVIRFKSSIHENEQGGFPLLIVILWVVVPYVIFSLFTHRFPRYTLPYLPAVALLTSLGLNLIPWQKIRNLIIMATAILGALQFACYSFDLGKLSQVHLRLEPLGIVAYHPTGFLWQRAAYQPQDQGAHIATIKDILTAISNDWNQKAETADVRILFNNSLANAITFNHYRALLCITNLEVSPLEDCKGSPIPILFQADYLLLSNEHGYSEQFGYLAEKPLKAIEFIKGKGEHAFYEHFEQLQTWQFDDSNIEIGLYKRRF